LAAVEAGSRVRYLTATDLVETLYRGLADDSVGRVVEGLLRHDLVIIDELGFAALDDVGTQLLFRFVAAAYERRSLPATAVGTRRRDGGHDARLSVAGDVGAPWVHPVVGFPGPRDDRPGRPVRHPHGSYDPMTISTTIVGAFLALVSSSTPGATTGVPSSTDAIPVASTPRATSVALHAPAGASARLRVEYGKRDSDGCRRLVVWKGQHRVAKIPSHAADCSRTRRQVPVYGQLYFDWTVDKTTGDPDDPATFRRRTDLWVTDGTARGTLRLTTLRDADGRGFDSCEAHWARAGARAIAAAEWCWAPRTDAWVSGRVGIILGAQLVRYLPIPRMYDFKLAGRRIVTTGTDAAGTELWVHDGRMVRVDIRPGPLSSNPRWLRDKGERIRFIANDGSGKAIWSSDGTVSGTRKVRSLN